MKMKYFQLLILLTTILSSGCSVNDTKPISESQIDTIELEQLANIAYDNESWEKVIRYYRTLTNKISNRLLHILVSDQVVPETWASGFGSAVE